MTDRTVNPRDPVPGRIVSFTREPELANRRGFLVVAPGPHGSLRIKFETELGTEVFRFAATRAEIIYVDVPFDALPAEYRTKAVKVVRPGSIATLPGKMVFSRQHGAELVFLADCNAGVYSIPLAVERARA